MANFFGVFNGGFFDKGTDIVGRRGVVVDVARGAVVVGATVVVTGIDTSGAAVVVVGSRVVVVTSRVVVGASTGTSASTKVLTARDEALLVESFETISLFDMPGNACTSRAARPAT